MASVVITVISYVLWIAVLVYATTNGQLFVTDFWVLFTLYVLDICSRLC